jgi:serine/threonine protein kinase
MSLPPDAPEGLCPRCLGALNFATETVGGDAEAAAARAPLSPEELAPQFPQLEILECLGRGGMGVVYKARQKSLDRLVALKLLAPERVHDLKFAGRFSHEAQALARLNHPNIVTIHDFGQAGGFFYLLMEYVDGVNLRQVIQSGSLNGTEALTIVPRVCEALQYAHEHGIVHCDIKPENLLLDKSGRVKIADFGIARMLDARTSDAEPAGTPQYMAPEQGKRPPTADHRADIYSLGVVLYELLTGDLPQGNFEPPSCKGAGDVRLDAVVMRAMEAKAEARFQTAADFRTEIEAISAAPAPSQPSTGKDHPIMNDPAQNKTSPKRVLAWAFGGAAALLLSLASVVMIIFYIWIRSGRSIPTPDFSTAPPAPIAPANAKAPPGNWSPATFSVHAPDGVHQTSENSWSIKGGKAFMQVRRKKDDSLELRFAYPFDDFIPPETIALLRTRWSLPQVEKLAGDLNITGEQLADLKAVSPVTDIPVTAADRQKLMELFNDYLAADNKPAAEQALAQAVANLDAKYYEPTLQRIGAIAGQVKQIFDVDQLAALSDRFSPRKAPP